MGDVRIITKPTMSENAGNLYVFVNDDFMDMSATGSKTKMLKPGEHTLSAILVRKEGSEGPVSGTVTVTRGDEVLVDALPLEVADWGEVNRVKTTFTVA